MKKNVSGQTISFRLLSTTDGSDVTSGSPTVYITGNGGTQVTGSGTITHEGNGEWSYAPIQAETNYDQIAFSMVLSGAFSQTINVFTTYPQTGDAYSAVSSLNDIDSATVNAACDTAISDAALATAAALATVDSNVDAILIDTGTDIPAQITALNDLDSAAVNAACDAALSDYGANTIVPPTAAEIRAEIDSNSTQLAAILVDTGTDLPATLATIAGYLDTEVTAILEDTGTTIPGLLSTIDTVVDAIKLITDNLPDSGALSSLASAVNLTTIDANVNSILVDTGTTLPAAIAALPNAAAINAEVDTALSEYDAPTNAEITTAISDLQSHGDANWGSSGENPNVLLSSEISSVTSQTEIILTSGSDQDDAYNNQSIVLYDDSNSDYPSVRVVTDYVGSTKTITIDNAPDFTLGSDDSVRIFVTAPGSTAPTAAQVADAVWDEAIADHTTSTTFGAKNQKVVPSETIEDYQGSAGGDATAANQTTIIGHLTAIKGSGFSDTTDSLEAIRDQGDTAWVTGSGGIAPTVEEIRSEIDSNSTQLAAILTDTNELQTNQGNWATADLSMITTNIGTLLTRLSSARAGYLDKLNVAGILANSDTADTYKANVSSLATSSEIAALDLLIDAIKTVTDNLNDITVADIIAGITDGTYDLKDMMKVIFSFAIGITNGGGTNTLHFRNTANTKNVITATVDEDNNRTAITLDVS